jgi:hypothetical protein
MGDLMPERVKDRFRWTVESVILSDLDAFQTELASAQATLGICKTE